MADDKIPNSTKKKEISGYIADKLNQYTQVREGHLLHLFGEFKSDILEPDDFSPNKKEKIINDFKKILPEKFSNEKQIEQYIALLKLQKNEDFKDSIMDFFYKYVYYSRYLKIYELFGAINGTQNVLDKELKPKRKKSEQDTITFNEYGSYKQETIDSINTVFRPEILDESNMIKLDEYNSIILNEENAEKINKVFAFLIKYAKKLSKVLIELASIKKHNIEIIKALKTDNENKNEKYNNIITTYIKSIYEIPPEIEGILKIMDFIYNSIYIPEIVKISNTPKKMDEILNDILDYIQFNNHKYDFVNSLLKINENILNMTKKITMIEWDKIENEDQSHQLYNSKELVKYINHVIHDCFPFILNYEFTSKDLKNIKKTQLYLTEIDLILKFFVFKTNGYNQLLKKREEKGVDKSKIDEGLKHIRSITFGNHDSKNNLTLYSCEKLITEDVVANNLTKFLEYKVKNGKEKSILEKLNEELSGVFSDFGINVNFVDKVLLIDEIFAPEPEWYRKEWWKSKYDNIEDWTNEYNKKIKPPLMTQIDDITTIDKSKFDRNSFEIFISGSLAPYYNEDRIRWKSYLWWYFNENVEEEKRKKANANRAVEPEAEPTENGKPSNKALEDCQMRESKCKAELADINNELERVKEKHKQEIEKLKSELASIIETKKSDIKSVEKLNGYLEKMSSMPKDSKKDIDVQLIDKMKEDLANISIKMTENDAIISALTIERDQCLQNLELYKKKEEDLEMKITECNKRNAELEDKLKEKAEARQEVSKEMKLLEKQNMALQEKYENSRERLSKLRKTISKEHVEHDKLSKQLFKCDKKTKTLTKQLSVVKSQKTISSLTVSSTPTPKRFSHKSRTKSSRPTPDNMDIIYHLLEKCLKKSYRINSTIPIVEYKNISNLFISPPTPKILIDILNKSTSYPILNEFLRLVLTFENPPVIKYEYFKYVLNLPNIDPAYKPYGKTTLDIAVSKPEYIEYARLLIQNGRFNINNEYKPRNLSGDFTRPIIQAILNKNKNAVLLILKQPDCMLDALDSKKKSAIDYVLEMSETEHKSFEYKNWYFGLMVNYNKKHPDNDDFSILNDSQIMKRLSWKLKNTLLDKDRPLFVKLYKEYYKNNPSKMAELPIYMRKTNGGTKRRRIVYNRTKRRSTMGGHTGYFGSRITKRRYMPRFNQSRRRL